MIRRLRSRYFTRLLLAPWSVTHLSVRSCQNAPNRVRSYSSRLTQGLTVSPSPFRTTSRQHTGTAHAPHRGQWPCVRPVSASARWRFPQVEAASRGLTQGHCPQGYCHWTGHGAGCLTAGAVDGLVGLLHHGALAAAAAGDERGHRGGTGYERAEQGGGVTPTCPLHLDCFLVRWIAVVSAALEFVAEFGECGATGHFGGEFFEGGFLAGLVQDAAAELVDDEVVADHERVVGGCG